VGYKNTFIPPSVELSGVDVRIRFGYIFGIAGTSFIGLTVIEMINPKLIWKRNNVIYFFAPAVLANPGISFIRRIKISI